MIRAASEPHLNHSGLGPTGLIFVAEMYGVQLDHLARFLGVSHRSAIATVSGWTRAGLTESAKLGPGPRWIWLTKAGLASCGLPYTASVPALSRLAHLRAVAAARLALAATPQFAGGHAFWRSERRLRARFGRRIGLREHVPDGEVHWPETVEPGPGTRGSDLAWAGECWAIEAELTPKTVARTAAIMREVLSRTGDYGCPAEAVIAPGQSHRHARAIYLCSPAARLVVARSRDTLGDLAERIEIRLLPPDARWRQG